MRQRSLGWLFFALAMAFAGCARTPLPEAGTPDAQLYVNRCGSCHQAIQPGSLTAEMWRMQVEAMRGKIADAGLTPLSPEEENAILAYLRRHAGHQ